ncbi:hypothetical protein FM114_14960 [Luteococcus japonicus LSP_Lj1]|uniref:Uncharacterized protein n=1 Tax=Luteococcus japonicus LSP_Lj1 TaxID=1255658 RepID=A0A1R4KIX5_9ACTN|nr:hypothetical protein FM114_14960 [Luteococcus japonicus LSP_Lj1]
MRTPSPNKPPGLPNCWANPPQRPAAGLPPSPGCSPTAAASDSSSATPRDPAPHPDDWAEIKPRVLHYLESAQLVIMTWEDFTDRLASVLRPSRTSST